jgi:hypothetical protein
MTEYQLDTGYDLSRVSCSHVGHIYRGPRRRNMHPRNGNAYQSHINHLRVAEVRDWHR